MEKINLKDKLDMIPKLWSPRIIAEVNESYVKLARIQGEFVWHMHEREDEMFYVVKGVLTMKFRDKDVTLTEGECIVIPKGVEHMPVAEDEVHIMLVEAKTTLNTGNVVNEMTMEDIDRI